MVLVNMATIPYLLIIPITLGIILIVFAGKIYICYIDKIHKPIIKNICNKLEIEERDLPIFFRVYVKQSIGVWFIRGIGILLCGFLLYRLFINPLWE